MNTIEDEDRLAQKYPQAIHPAGGRGLLCAGELNLDNLVTQLTQSCFERDLIITPTWNRVVRIILSLLVSEISLRKALVFWILSCYQWPA